jgi:glutamyl-tRNA reductase
VASVAVELAEKIFDSLAGRTVLVVGAGETGEKTARALVSRGAGKLWVTNRSEGRAAALVGELGGVPIPFGAWPARFDEVDIAICSTAAPHYVIDRATLAPLVRRREYRPLLLIDIAVPRDIDPAINDLENVYLYDVDDLQAIADGYLQQRHEEVVRCETLIRERVAEWSRLSVKRPVPPSSVPAQ